MTAFGSGELSTAQTQYRCEIRTLNSRFCDISIKLPRSLLALEPKLLTLIKSRLPRGKVDVFFDVSQMDKTAHLPSLNPDAAAHYLRIGAELAKLNPGLKALSTYDLLKLEGTLESGRPTSSEAQLKSHESSIFAVINQALDRVIEQRESEGAVLRAALEKLVEAVKADREAILAKRETIQAALYETYKKRLERLLGIVQDSAPGALAAVPEERLLAEIAILTDRADIEEELTRLKAHEDEFLRILHNEEEAGRKLDFLCQEMHREVNTISSKLTQLEIQTHSLTLKQTIERLKQQVQNIE